jgi:hypothetical protein
MTLIEEDSKPCSQTFICWTTIPMHSMIDDDERPEKITNGEGVVDIDGLISLGDDISTLDDVKVPEAQASNVPMERVMDQLKETMQDIMEECIEGGVALCIHVTSFLKVVCANVHTNHLIKGYESLYLNTIFNQVENGMGCFVKQRKIWHKRMVAHKFAHTLRAIDV